MALVVLLYSSKIASAFRLVRFLVFSNVHFCIFSINLSSVSFLLRIRISSSFFMMVCLVVLKTIQSYIVILICTAICIVILLCGWGFFQSPWISGVLSVVLFAQLTDVVDRIWFSVTVSFYLVSDKGWLIYIDASGLGVVEFLPDAFQTGFSVQNGVRIEGIEVHILLLSYIDRWAELFKRNKI